MPDVLGVVLPGEDLVRAVQGLAGRGLLGEGTLLAAEFPVDGAGAQADVVSGPGVARVDEQVAVAVQVHGIDVEPVPWRAGRGRQRLLAVAVGASIRAVPLEQHLAGAGLYLLDQ